MPGIVSGIGSAVGGIAGAFGSMSAAQQAARASNYATNLQLAQWQYGQNMLAPYVSAGWGTNQQLQPLLQPGGYLDQTYQYTPYQGRGVPTAPTIRPYAGPSVPYETYGGPAVPYETYTGPGVPTVPTITPYTGPGINYNVPQAPTLTPWSPTQAALEQMPGYQFEMAQGLKGIQAANAAQGRGVSGAAMQQAGAFAQGLAATDLGNYYNQWQGSNNMLLAGYGAQLQGYQTGVGAQNQGFNQWLGANNLNLSQYQTALAGQQNSFNQWLGGYQQALAAQNQDYSQWSNSYTQALNAQSQGFGQWQSQGQMTLQDYQNKLAAQQQNYNQWQTGQTTAQQIFAANQANMYNRLMGVTQLGEAAGAGAAATTAQMAPAMAQSITQAGQFQAAGTMGAANALTGGIANLTKPQYVPGATPGQPGSYQSPVGQAVNYVGNLLFGSGGGGAAPGAAYPTNYTTSTPFGSTANPELSGTNYNIGASMAGAASQPSY